jgi:hypothetical protein
VPPKGADGDNRPQRLGGAGTRNRRALPELLVEVVKKLEEVETFNEKCVE